MIAEKEKFTTGSWKGYSPRENGFALFGIFSLSLLPMLQKYSLINDTIPLLPLTVWPSTERLGTTVVFDLLLITWLMVFQVLF